MGPAAAVTSVRPGQSPESRGRDTVTLGQSEARVIYSEIERHVRPRDCRADTWMILDT